MCVNYSISDRLSKPLYLSLTNPLFMDIYCPIIFLIQLLCQIYVIREKMKTATALFKISGYKRAIELSGSRSLDNRDSEIKDIEMEYSL